jgi:hypothetical protein
VESIERIMIRAASVHLSAMCHNPQQLHTEHS